MGPDTPIPYRLIAHTYIPRISKCPLYSPLPRLPSWLLAEGILVGPVLCWAADQAA